MASNYHKVSQVSTQVKVSSQESVKEISQVVINPFNSDTNEINPGNESSGGKLSMSRNIATKLTQLTVNSDLSHTNSETVVGDTFCDLHYTNKNLSSRATAKQVFPNIACLPSENNIVFCFVLSVWDNIVGPQTVYVWKKKSRPSILKNGTYEREKKESTQSKEHRPSLSDFNEEKFATEVVCTHSIPSRNSTIEDSQDRNKRTLVQSNSVRAPSTNINDCTKNRIQQPTKPKKRLCLSTVVKYVTEHTIGVEECGQWKANKMVFYLLTVPHQDIITISVRFHIIEEGVGVPYCLSAVVPSHNESSLAPVLSAVMETMYRIAAKVRLLITKEGLAGGDKIRRNLQELCLTMSSLKEASLRLYPLTTLARMPDDRRLAERILTSHMQTMGTTLVIADSPHEANQVVMWLGQFLSEDDMSTSRIALSDAQWPFQPELSIQAVTRGANGAIDLSSSKLLASRRPLTLVDLGSNSVRQMDLMNVHAKNSCMTFRMELLALWHDLDHMPAPSQSIFEPVEAVAPMVKRFLSEWDRLAACEVGIRRVFLEAFLRSVQYAALSIISWLRHEGLKGKRRRDPKSILHDISSAFLVDEPDLRIILAQAEKLEPGLLYSFLSKKVKD